MTILEFLDQVPPYVTYGGEYNGKTYGKHARYLDFESNVGIIFDERTLEIYECSIRNTDESIVWRDEAYEEIHINEMKAMGTPNYAIDDERSNIDTIEEMVEQVKKYYADRE